MAQVTASYNDLDEDFQPREIPLLSVSDGKHWVAVGLPRHWIAPTEVVARMMSYRLWEARHPFGLEELRLRGDYEEITHRLDRRRRGETRYRRLVERAISAVYPPEAATRPNPMTTGLIGT